MTFTNLLTFENNKEGKDIVQFVYICLSQNLFLKNT